MLLVKTQVRPSSIQGVGLFAVEPIKKGTIVYQFRSEIDVQMTDAQVMCLPDCAREFVKTYAWKTEVWWTLCGDNARFINHSSMPNLVNGEGNTSVAARDIEADEELTEDYSSFDDDFSTYAKKLIEEA